MTSARNGASGSVDQSDGESVATGQHKWDEDGERCERCGEKDWFSGPVCMGTPVNVVACRPEYSEMLSSPGWQ